MRLAVAALAVIACGRINFVPLGSADDGGRDGAASDGTSGGFSTACSPTRAEVCNGIDDNCDGQIDEGCPCTPFDITIPTAGLIGVQLVWTGDGYLLQIMDTASVVLVSIAADGTIGPKHPSPLFFNGAGDGGAVWLGSTLVGGSIDNSGCSSFVNCHVAIEQFDATGAAVAAPVTLVSTSQVSRAAIAWVDDHLAVAWYDDTSIYVGERLLDGTVIGSDVTVASGVQLSTIVATIDGYLIATIPTSGTGAAVVYHLKRASGAITQATLAIASATGYPLQLVAGPNGFAATRSVGGSGIATTVQGLDATGATRTPAIAVPTTASSEPLVNVGLAATPTAYVIAGQQQGASWITFVDTYDGSLAVTSGPTALFTSTSGATADSAAHAYAGRSVFAFEFAGTAAGTRVVQTCP